MREFWLAEPKLYANRARSGAAGWSTFAASIIRAAPADILRCRGKLAGLMTIAFMTEADLLPPQQPQLRAYWLSSSRTPCISGAGGGTETRTPGAPLRWVAAGKEIMDCSSGAPLAGHWRRRALVVPLSAQGMFKRRGQESSQSRPPSGARTAWRRLVDPKSPQLEPYLLPGKPITFWKAGGLAPHSGSVGTDSGLNRPTPPRSALKPSKRSCSM